MGHEGLFMCLQYLCCLYLSPPFSIVHCPHICWHFEPRNSGVPVFMKTAKLLTKTWRNHVFFTNEKKNLVWTRQSPTSEVQPRIFWRSFCWCNIEDWLPNQMFDIQTCASHEVLPKCNARSWKLKHLPCCGGTSPRSPNKFGDLKSRR